MYKNCSVLLLPPGNRTSSCRSSPRPRQAVVLCCNQQSLVLEELKSLGVRPKRSLGQNFLISKSVLSDIVRAASVEAGDHILEIGPGLGTLTAKLVDNGATILAIEKDDVLARHMERKFAEVPQVTVVHEDVLKVRQLPLLLKGFQPAHGGKIGVVANIPYSITSELLEILLPMRDAVQSLHLLLEEGAARRLTQARPGDKDYRAMSVVVGLYAKPRLCFSVSRHSFYPVPGVESAVAEFILHEQLDDGLRQEEEGAFIAFVHAAFSMKRKTLGNNLKSWKPDVQSQIGRCLESCGFPAQIRAEALCVSDFVALFNCMRREA